MVKEVKEADEVKDKEGAVEAKEDAVEELKEVPSEDAPEGITEKTEESSKKDENSTDSEDTADSAPSGISDEELSRVFEAIPKKSKVALDRVESRMDNVKDAKSSPVWYPWVFSIIMVIGQVWAVVYYLTGNYPIPHIGAWNLFISFVTILVGFAMTMFWK